MKKFQYLRDWNCRLRTLLSGGGNAADPDLKRFADKYSKVVQSHLDMAKGIQSKLK